MDAIRTHAPFWQESLTPWVLRQRGRLTVEFAQRRAQFVLRLPGGRREWYRPVLRGRVSARVDGGCDIVAAIGLTRWAYLGPAALFALGLSQLFVAPIATVFLLIAAMWSGIAVERRIRRVRASDDVEANFLLQRLRIALDEVDAVEPRGSITSGI